MQTLQVDLGAASYPISIGAGLLTDRNLLEQQIPGRDLLIVTNTIVAKLYLAKLSGSFSQRHALLQFAENIFGYNDSIIHHQSGS